MAGTTWTSSQPSSHQLSRICFVACTRTGTVTYSHLVMRATLAPGSPPAHRRVRDPVLEEVRAAPHEAERLVPARKGTRGVEPDRGGPGLLQRRLHQLGGQPHAAVGRSGQDPPD